MYRETYVYWFAGRIYSFFAMGRENLCIFFWQTPVPFAQVPEAGKSTEEPSTNPLEALPGFIQMDFFQWNSGYWLMKPHNYIYMVSGPPRTVNFIYMRGAN